MWNLEKLGESRNFITFEIPFIRGIDINNGLGWISAEKIFSLSEKIDKKTTKKKVSENEIYCHYFRYF